MRGETVNTQTIIKRLFELVVNAVLFSKLNAFIVKSPRGWNYLTPRSGLNITSRYRATTFCIIKPKCKKNKPHVPALNNDSILVKFLSRFQTRLTMNAFFVFSIKKYINELLGIFH